ncbi:MAG TPA: CHAD domain-containing protein [Bryobacteraceae bacterium]|nr:CHAD domain-containing protein [Bryobacteraceae bacterium]
MKPKWKPSVTAAEGARVFLPQLADKYFNAGRKAADKTRSTKALHQFRIATKRFRYSLELFQPVFGASLDRRLDALRKLQRSLGKLNDYRAILKLVADDETLQAQLEKAIKRQLKEFRRRWKTFDSHGQLKSWKTYLAGARAPSSPASRRRPAAP